MTSPPYYALRDYGMDRQIGREKTPGEYISRLTKVFAEVRRVLRPDGTLWLTIADTYAGQASCAGTKVSGRRKNQPGGAGYLMERYKKKDLLGIPWWLAFALRNDGWYLRNDIIWMKQNPMPESCKDRCSRCYEHIFLFSKSRKYFFNFKAISEPISPETVKRLKRGITGSHKYSGRIPGQPRPQTIHRSRKRGGIPDDRIPRFRNKRDVWVINTVPFHGRHYAAYPPKLAATCLLAGCPEDGVVLDPFMGSGTTGMVAKQMGRDYVGIELNPDYTQLAEERIRGENPVR